MRYITPRIACLLLSGALSAAEPQQTSEPPAQVELHKAQWRLMARAQSECLNRLPSQKSHIDKVFAQFFAALTDADLMIREDAAVRGEDGKKYLALYIREQNDGPGRIDPERISPTIESCKSLLQALEDVDAQKLTDGWTKYFTIYIDAQGRPIEKGAR